VIGQPNYDDYAAGLFHHRGKTAVWNYANNAWTNAKVWSGPIRSQSGFGVAMSNDGSIVALGWPQMTWPSPWPEYPNIPNWPLAAHPSQDVGGVKIFWKIPAAYETVYNDQKEGMWWKWEQTSIEYNDGFQIELSQQTIRSTDLHSRLGESIAMSSDGSIIVAGAPGNSASTSEGFVKIFKGDISTGWAELCTIDGPSLQNGREPEYFGGSVATSANGRIVAVGAPLYDAPGAPSDEDSGIVRVYRHSIAAQGNTEYTPVGNPIVGGAIGERFGHSLDLSADGTRLAVGGPDYDADPNDIETQNHGRVRVYRYVSGNWVENGFNIPGSTQNERFGTSVALSKNAQTLVVGAPYYNENKGKIQIFVPIDDMDSDRAEPEEKYDSILGNHAGSRHGQSIAIVPNGTIVVTGRDNGIDVQRHGPDGWTNIFTTEIPNEGFGKSVAISDDGNWIAAGAPGSSTNTRANMRAYHYNSSTGTYALNFTAAGSLGGSEGEIVAVSSQEPPTFVFCGGGANNDNDECEVLTIVDGQVSVLDSLPSPTGVKSVSISPDGSSLAIGHPTDSAVYFWEKQNEGGVLAQSSLIQGDSGEEFGTSVALSEDGNTVVVGSPESASSDTEFQGKASIYTRDNPTADWVLVKEIRRPSLGATQKDIRFGETVAISKDGTRVVLGAPDYDNSGGLLSFHERGDPCERRGRSQRSCDFWAKTTEILGGFDERLGSIIAVSGDASVAATGAPHYDDTSVDSDEGRTKFYAGLEEAAPTDDSDDDDSDDDDSGLSTGAVVGIAVGATAGASAIGFSLWYCGVFATAGAYKEVATAPFL
jgi:WD40 repeat protein